MSTFDIWARNFLDRRVQQEGFDPSRHSFTVFSPKMQFIETLLTGHLTNFYYMSREDVLRQSLMLHERILMEDPNFHLLALQFARHISFKKDQIVLGLITRASKGYIDDALIDLLADFPPNVVLHRFYEQIKLGIVPRTVSKKKIVKTLARVVDKWKEEGKLPLFAVKYRKDLRDIVRITHTMVPGDVWAVIFRRREYYPLITDPFLRGYLKFLELVRQKKYNEALEVASSVRLPFSIVRSSVPSLYWNEKILDTMTNLDLAMFSISLYKTYRTELINKLVETVEKRGRNIPSWYSARTLLACLDRLGIDNELTIAWGKAFATSVAETWKKINVHGLELENAKILLILDASGSMWPTDWRGVMWRGIAAVAPLAENVKGLIMYSDEADFEEPKLLKTLDGWVQLRKIATLKYNQGTDLAAALFEAVDEVKRGEYTDVLIITDEQVNINKLPYRELELLQEIVKHCNVMILNPTPYPVHVADPSRIRYVFGLQAEDVLTSLILTRLLKDEEKIAKTLELTIYASCSRP